MRHHRFRFYPKAWSTFDDIEPCKSPAFCMGCAFDHPFCNERGILEKPDGANIERTCLTQATKSD